MRAGWARSAIAIRKMIVIVGREDIVTFVAGDSDPLAGIRRRRDAVAVYRTGGTASGASVDIAA